MLDLPADWITDWLAGLAECEWNWASVNLDGPRSRMPEVQSVGGKSMWRSHMDWAFKGSIVESNTN